MAVAVFLEMEGKSSLRCYFTPVVANPLAPILLPLSAPPALPPLPPEPVDLTMRPVLFGEDAAEDEEDLSYIT